MRLAGLLGKPLKLFPRTFINARRSKLKLLAWERNGFIVWHKRLERDKFH